MLHHSYVSAASSASFTLYVGRNMNNSIQIESGGFEMLNKAEALWYELKAEQTVYNADFVDLSTPTFELRQSGLRSKSSAILVSIATDTLARKAIAYCISSIDKDSVGEIESLYVREQLRRSGIGEALMETAIRWMKSENAKAIHLNVFHANKGAVAFYTKMGFRHRLVQMMIPNAN